MQWPHVRLNPDSNPAGNGEEGFYTWDVAQTFRDSWRPPSPRENFGYTVGENVRVVQAGLDKVRLIAIRVVSIVQSSVCMPLSQTLLIRTTRLD